jgi:hypothetical protein
MAEGGPRELSQVFDHPGNKKSIVWKYFGFKKLSEGPASKSNLDLTTAYCKLCGKSYKNKGKH